MRQHLRKAPSTTSITSEACQSISHEVMVWRLSFITPRFDYSHLFSELEHESRIVGVWSWLSWSQMSRLSLMKLDQFAARLVQLVHRYSHVPQWQLLGPSVANSSAQPHPSPSGIYANLCHATSSDEIRTVHTARVARETLIRCTEHPVCCWHRLTTHFFHPAAFKRQ